MASPQVEKGHTRIANEILEQVMKTNLNGTQFRIVIVVWRFTYGFQRKTHEISISFIARSINSSRSHVHRELKVLIDRKIITVAEIGPRKEREIGFNKNYAEWTSCIPSKKETIKKVAAPPAPKQKPKKTKNVYEENNRYFKMAKYFYSKVKGVARSEGLEHLTIKANLQNWADEFRKLVEIGNNQDIQLIKDVMDWVTEDDFWKTNVLSAKKFRDKFPDLAIKMKAGNKPKNKPKQPDARDKDLEFQKHIDAGGKEDEFDWS